MKKNGFVLTFIVFILTILSCNRTNNTNFEDVIEISIDSENEIIKKDASNFLTVNIKNNNNEKQNNMDIIHRPGPGCDRILLSRFYHISVGEPGQRPDQHKRTSRRHCHHSTGH